MSHLIPASSDFIKGVIWAFKNKGRNDQSFDLTHTFPRSPLLQPLLTNKKAENEQQQQPAILNGTIRAGDLTRELPSCLSHGLKTLQNLLGIYKVKSEHFTAADFLPLPIKYYCCSSFPDALFIEH